MKDWKTTAGAIVVALTALASAKNWIDNETAICIGAIAVAFGLASAKDAKKE